MLEDDSSLETTVEFSADDDGYFGRECPMCGRYFKVVATEQFVEQGVWTCPYCEESAEHTVFLTEAQKNFVFTQGVNQLQEALSGYIENYSGWRYEPVNVPVLYYKEDSCETRITCANCELAYAVYGVFACCPQCGQHNTFQTLAKNLELAERFVILAASLEEEEAQELLESTLNKVVSRFEGFGKRLQAKQDKTVSFQNLIKARQNLRAWYGIEMKTGLTDDEWDVLTRAFQKRHVHQHNSGVADEAYLQFANDSSAALGRKVTLSADEVRSVADMLKRLGLHLEAAFSKLKP